MADEAPSLMTWIRTQVRRKPVGDGEDAPGIGGGLRMSRGLVIALVLAVVVVVVVLTSGDGGTPGSNTAESASPSAGTEANESPSPGAAEPSGSQAEGAPPASGTPGAAADPAERKPVGTTAYTRNTRGLTVRSEPNNGSEAVAGLEYDTQVTLLCHTQGQIVYGRKGLKSSLWDKVSTPGGNVGFVPDAWVVTEAEVPTLVSPC